MDIGLVYHKLKISFSNCAAPLALVCFLIISTSNMLFAENIPTLPNPSDTQNAEEYYDTTVFDLYLNDTPIGNILANFSDTWFEIDSPGDVVEQLQSKITGGELKLQELCTGKIMGRRELSDIGSVIFDPNTFRIILSIDPKYLKVGGVSRSNLLPDPERALAIQQGVQVTSSGNTSEFPASSSLSHRTRFSLGKSYLRGEGTFNQESSESGSLGDESSYTLTELSAGTFWGVVQQDLGLLRTSGTRLIGSVEYAGTKVENTDQVLVDQDLVRGSPIRIFVPSRSRVEFFQGSRLLESQILNAGLQEIDTSSFPQGSYDIEVRIHESSGNIIQERHFFAKSGLLAVQARPVVTLEGGRLRNSSDIEEGYVYHGGLRWRALSFLQLEPAFFGSDTVKIGSLDLTGILGQTTFFLSGAYGNDKSKGVSGSLYGRLPLQVSWNAGFQASSDAKDSDSNNLETNKSGLSRDIGINPGLRSFYGRVERRFGKLSLSFMGNKTGKQEEIKKDFGPPEQDKDSEQPSYVYGPGFSYPLYTGVAGSIGLSGSYLWSDTRDGYQMFINYNKQLAPTWTLGSHAEASTVGRSDNYRGGTSLDYYKGGRGAEKSSFRWREDMVRTSDPIEGDRNSLASSANFEYGTSLFNSRGYIYDYQSDTSSSTTFGVLGESSLLYTDGEVSVTQGSGVESAVVVELKSKSVKDSTFDVLINDSNYERIPAGRSSLIALSPFRTYRLRLKQSNESQELVSLDTEVYEVTLFPGNIIKKTWNAEKIYIALGRLVDEKGRGVRHQRLKGLQEYTITEEDGSFQAEVSGTERVYVSNNDYECEIKIPEKAPLDETIVDLGDIPCSTKDQSKNSELLSFLVPQSHRS